MVLNTTQSVDPSVFCTLSVTWPSAFNTCQFENSTFTHRPLAEERESCWNVSCPISVERTRLNVQTRHRPTRKRVFVTQAQSSVFERVTVLADSVIIVSKLWKDPCSVVPF